MTPSDIDQAQTIAAALPENAASILIVSENDHDGRAGKQEMLRALQKIHAGSVRTIEMNRDDAASGNLLDELKQRTPNVVILWIRPESTNRVLALIAEQAPRATSFLSQKSAEFVSTAATLNSHTSTTEQSDGLRLFVPSAKTEEEAAPTGIDLTRGEVAIYRAVRLLAQAIKESGANRARLRDNLANSCRQFDAAGNRVAKWILVPGGKLTSPSPSEALSSAHLPHGTIE
jgi:ABC-type branched-subunit amino acid transport system substrate-binding protein